MAEWTELLEDREVEIEEETGFTSGVRIEAPYGFGKSEYNRMVEELWDDDEVRTMTPLERSVDFFEDTAGLTRDSITSMYETTVSGEFDTEEYMWGLMGTIFGIVGIGLAAASLPIGKIDRALTGNLDAPLYTASNSIYDTEADTGEQGMARVFYTEKPSEREIKITPASYREEADPAVVKDAVEYLESFEA
jgi:hypothetical protein